MRVPFVKLDGAGNDFVGIDWRGRTPLPDDMAGSLARLLCNRHHGIGADGVLMIEDPREPGTDFTMLYINADGSIGSMCGNGARCIARLAHYLGAAPSEMSFLTGDGVYRAEIRGELVRVAFRDVPMTPEWRELQGTARPLQHMHFLHVGVPHAVAFVEDLDLQDVASMGREVRHDPAFSPAGTNANFAEERGGRLYVRTYERGVEEETRACGTGSVATCCVHAWAKKLRGPQTFVITPSGGIPLEIGFEVRDTGFHHVSLAGPAVMRYSGEFNVSADLERLDWPE